MNKKIEDITIHDIVRSTTPELSAKSYPGGSLYEALVKLYPEFIEQAQHPQCNQESSS